MLLWKFLLNQGFSDTTFSLQTWSPTPQNVTILFFVFLILQFKLKIYVENGKKYNFPENYRTNYNFGRMQLQKISQRKFKSFSKVLKNGSIYILIFGIVLFWMLKFVILYFFGYVKNMLRRASLSGGQSIYIDI